MTQEKLELAARYAVELTAMAQDVIATNRYFVLGTAHPDGHPRVSPKGDRVAFIDHPVQGDDSGTIAVVDSAGRKTTLTDVWYTVQGLAWTPDGSQVWFTASRTGVGRNSR